MRNQISERVIDFIAIVLKMVGELPPTTIAGKLSDQLIRSSTSVGANYEEAQAAESRRDFVHKLQVSLKEMPET
jgi:four helix bundle protein